MISTEILWLCGTAAMIGLVHTALGPDHYLPFVLMGRVRNWSLRKTIWVTVISGSGHVLSSVVLGLIGVYFGSELMKLEALEGFRGNIAAWLLIGFGFAYFIWGIFLAIKNKKHSHVHFHESGVVHDHPHSHTGNHAHIHDYKSKAKDLTPWVLFTIFILGPCEPLIPLLMYPAAESSMLGMYLVTAVFAIVTLATMVSIVVLGIWGISFANMGKLEKYTHAIAGATICFSGLAIMFLGL